MENQKDKNNITLFNDNKLINNILIKDTGLSYIIKKTERIATAIYMISNFLDKEEPLKWELRKIATMILKNVMSFNNSALSNKESVNLKVNSNFVELGALFNLAYNSGFISQMNFQIVSNEITNLVQIISDYDKGQISGNQTLFDKTYFEVKKEIDTKKDNYQKTQLNNVVNEKAQLTSSIKDIKDRIVFKGHKNDLNEFFENQLHSRTQSVQHSDRIEKIMTILKTGGQHTVKDISDHFKDVSEKTIQRELQRMVDNGQIKKEGERRWTKYFL